jgi:hypothetical protein
MVLYPQGTPASMIRVDRERVVRILEEGVEMGGTGARPAVGLIANLFDARVLIDARMRGKVVEYRTEDGWAEVPDGAMVSMKFGNKPLVTKQYVSPRIDRSRPWLDDPEAEVAEALRLDAKLRQDAAECYRLLIGAKSKEDTTKANALLSSLPPEYAPVPVESMNKRGQAKAMARNGNQKFAILKDTDPADFEKEDKSERQCGSADTRQ